MDVNNHPQLTVPTPEVSLHSLEIYLIAHHNKTHHVHQIINQMNIKRTTITVLITTITMKQTTSTIKFYKK